MTLTIGNTAPDFTLQDQDGKTHSLKDYQGKKIILYFYPKDDTPGCTKEACGFRDDYTHWKKKNVVILGISTDTEQSHKKFAEKYKLPFPLLADTDKNVVNTYGVYGKKSMYGRTYYGIYRTTFIINAEGKIQEIISKVDTETHSKDLLASLMGK